jgi:hypothetical protein
VFTNLNLGLDDEYRQEDLTNNKCRGFAVGEA